MWKFTKETGMELLNNDSLEFKTTEEALIDWLRRICNNSAPIRKWGIESDIRLELYQVKQEFKYAYLVIWDLFDSYEYVFIPDFSLLTEFLKSYLPIISNSLQTEIFQKFLEPSSDIRYGELMDKVKEFLKHFDGQAQG